MNIRHKTENHTLTVSLCGELDESCAARVRAEIDALTSDPNVRRTVFDLAGVTFMDSTGIGMLIGRYKVLKARGIPIMLASPQGVVDKLLSLSGLYEIMPKIN